MRAFGLLFAAVLFACPQFANAAIIETGQDLQKACHAADQLSNCLTFLQAVHKTAKEIARASDTASHRITGACGPDKGIDTLPLAVGLRDAWYEYADRHPEHLHQRAAEAVLTAIEEKWPCDRDEPQ